MDFYVDLTACPDQDGENACEVIGGCLTVTIMDDDEPGILSFDHETYYAEGDAKSVDIKINRRCGANGKLTFDLETEDGTAKEGIDFEKFEAEGELDNEVRRN
jgi:hypothetical protein